MIAQCDPDKRRSGKETEPKNGPCRPTEVSCRNLVAKMRQQKTRWNDAGQCGQGKTPELETTEACGIADKVDRNKRQKARHENGLRKHILRPE